MQQLKKGEIEKIKVSRQHEYPKLSTWVKVRLKNAAILKSTIACYRAVRWAVIACNNGVITKVTLQAAEWQLAEGRGGGGSGAYWGAGEKRVNSSLLYT